MTVFHADALYGLRCCLICGTSIVDELHSDELLTDDNGARPAAQFLCRQHAADYELVLCVDTADYRSSDDTYFTEDTEEHYASSRHLYYDDRNGCWLASEPEDDESCGLRSYGTDVLNVHGWPDATPMNSLCMGVELEMEPRSGYRQSDLVDALECVPDSILKEDGSLTSGVELVTLPFTLDYHRTRFNWSGALAGVQNIGKSGAGTSNCGMHVHVNRKALSPLTIGKVLVFLNAAHNAAFVNKVAQRGHTGYARRDTGKKLTDIYGMSRYDLLNVSGSRTIEFRLFRGNLRPERVIKNLEFCVALIRFCENSGIKKAAQYTSFLEFLSKRHKEYPTLCAYLATVGFPAVADATMTEAAAALSDL